MQIALLREAAWLATLYPNRTTRPSPQTKTIDIFSEVEFSELAAAVRNKELPPDDLRDKVLRNYVMTKAINVAQNGAVTMGGEALFLQGTAKNAWPRECKPCVIWNAAMHNIANNAPTYKVMTHFIENSGLAQKLNDFLFATPTSKVLKLPCPTDSCANPRLPAPRTLPAIPSSPTSCSSPPRTASVLPQPCASHQPPTCCQADASPFFAEEPKPETAEAPGCPHDRRVRRRVRDRGGEKQKEAEDAELTRTRARL